MPEWVLADAHGGVDRDADRQLLAVLDRAIVLGVDLLCLGDLFEVWIGRESCWTELQRDVMDRILALRAQGGRVRFVVGNRDYLVGPEYFDEVIEEPAVVSLGGAPTLVAHGDRLVSEDRLYRAWFSVSRSRASSAMLRRAPGPWVRRGAERLEARLSNTNPQYKTGTLPLAALDDFGRDALARGARRALCGHFHHERLLDTPGVPVQLAPAWFVQRRVLRAAPDGHLESFNPLEVD